MTTIPGITDFPELLMEGVLPPDLQGTLVRIGPGGSGGASGAGGADAANGQPGMLHAIELRDGKAVSYIARASAADTNVFWHGGSVLALAEFGLPLQYSRELDPREFGGGLTVPISSHTRLEAATGRRVLFGVDDSGETPVLRFGEWAADGSLASAQVVPLERATWQHDIGITPEHLVFVESPTEPLGAGASVDYRWAPGAEGWLGVVRRADGMVEDAATQWLRLDPSVVTHVLGAVPLEDGRAIDVYVVVYPAPEKGQPVDLEAPVVGSGSHGIGMSTIGGGLGVLERWRISGVGEASADLRLERRQVDERFVEYPRVDGLCEGGNFRYGYGVELGFGLAGTAASADAVEHFGLLKFDFERDEVASWSPGVGREASEPLFVRGDGGRSDDEGWVLCVVDDSYRGGSDLYVLDASAFGRRSPQAVIHLPDGVRLPFRSHGTWVSASWYR